MGHDHERYAEGEEFVTRSRTVTRSDIDIFTNLVGIHEPLFKNREYYEETRFGGLITPGPFVFSLSAAATLSDAFSERVIAFLGLDRLNIEAPVHVEDTITSFVTISKSRPTSSGDEAVVTFHVTVENQNGETVLTWDGKMLVERSRGGGGSRRE